MFDARDRGILDLTGLEHATNLTELSLQSNQISDVSALASLTNLTELVLRSNPLSPESIDIHVPNLRSRGVDVAR